MRSQSTQTSSENVCCICGSNGSASPFAYRREAASLLRCQSCRLIYSDRVPRPEADFISSARNESVEYWSFPEMYAKHRPIFTRFFAERLARMRKHAPSSDLGLTLDVGCGYGFWMSFLREKGISAVGLDESEQAVSYAKKQGLRVEKVTFENYESETRFGAMVMCDVLEHFVRPDLMLKKSRELLEPDGLLYVQVPNVIGLRLPYGHNLGLPHHLWQFNPTSLRLLLDKCGFEPLEYWTGVQGVIGIYEKGGPSLLKSTQWGLARILKIGNRLQVLARRRR